LENNMDHFDTAIVGARELSDDELMLIQGGNIFGDAWNWVKGAASDVGHAVGSAATATWNAVTSPGVQKGLKTVGTILGIVGGAIALFAGGHSSTQQKSSSSV
jgi:hypothetical protein